MLYWGLCENWKRSAAGDLTKEPLTVPSMVRRAKYENLEAFLKRIDEDKNFVGRWISVEKKKLDRKRKERSELVDFAESSPRKAA